MFGVFEAIFLVECIIIVILVVVIIALAVSAKKHKELQAEAASPEGATLPAEVEQQQFDAPADVNSATAEPLTEEQSEE